MENARTWRGCKGGSQRNLHRPQRQQTFHATVMQLRTLLLGLLHSPWALAGCRTGALPAPCRKRRGGRSESHDALTSQEAEHSPPSCPQAQKTPFGFSKAKLISRSSRSTESWCRGTALNRDGGVINQTYTKPPPVKESKRPTATPALPDTCHCCPPSPYAVTTALACHQPHTSHRQTPSASTASPAARPAPHLPATSCAAPGLSLRAPQIQKRAASGQTLGGTDMQEGGSCPPAHTDPSAQSTTQHCSCPPDTVKSTTQS